MLINFLSNSNTPRVQEMKRQARSISFIVLHGARANNYQEDKGFLPSLIVSTINKMPNAFALGLKVYGLSRRERSALQTQVKSARRCTAITHLKVDLPNPVFRKLINTTLQVSLIQAIDVDTEIRIRHLNMLGAHLPNIRRLRVKIRDPCIGYRKLIRRHAPNQAQICFPSFHNLECLVVADAGSPARPRSFGSHQALRANLREFNRSLANLRSLRRLAIEFWPGILLWISDHDLEEGSQQREELNEVLGTLTCDMGYILPNLEEMCLVESTAFQDLVHKGKRSMAGQVMNTTHEVAGSRDTFPLGILY
ncbi:hypothetical protein HG530_011454 [Fusarium avenaceum]|nr:hypothetical protein HG530_011454 [Fusarium avenaceum]